MKRKTTLPKMGRPPKVPKGIDAAARDPFGFVPIWRHYFMQHLLKRGVDRKWLKANLAFVMAYQTRSTRTVHDWDRYMELKHPRVGEMEPNMRTTLRELTKFNPLASPHLRAAGFIISMPQTWEMKAAEVVDLMKAEDKALPARARQFTDVTAKTIEKTRALINEALKR